VTAVVPLNGANGVGITNTIITAQFSEPMAPIIAANFTVACTTPCAKPPTGTVALDAAKTKATFTLTNSPLLALTTYTATVTGAKSLATGLALASPFIWNFTTGATPDTTRPSVTFTVPADATPGVPGVAINTVITAVFSEEMNFATLETASGATSFTLTCAFPCLVSPVPGTVTYVVGSRTAVFKPTALLTPGALYTATITAAATDLSGNLLLSPVPLPVLPQVRNPWTFTTAAAPALDTTAPVINSTNPVDGAANVAVAQNISATFNETMNTTSVVNAFTLTAAPGAVSVPGIVNYDPVTSIATFDPTLNLTPGVTYTAMIANTATDLAGNPLVVPVVLPVPNSWSFTVPAIPPVVVVPVVNLGAAAPFGNFGGAGGITNQGIDTVINGDIGTTAASTLITGFHDVTVPYAPPLGCIYTETPLNIGPVNGAIYTAAGASIPTASCPLEGSAATAAIATQARADALAAFTAISPAVLLGGIAVENVAACPTCGGGAPAGPSQLGGRTLPPGIYKSTPGTYSIGALGDPAGNLTLDGGGDVNAVWVFQTAALTGTLTVGLTGPLTPLTPIQVLCINGCNPKNVFWYAPAGATIGTGSTMVGTILSDAAITISTAGVAPLPVVTTLNGRALTLTAGNTIVNTVINVPAP
jgi:hypothetical protein